MIESPLRMAQEWRLPGAWKFHGNSMEFPNRFCATLLPLSWKRHELSDAGKCMQPHVECLYYHTKQGAKNLEYFKTHAAGALAWHGNVCERV